METLMQQRIYPDLVVEKLISLFATNQDIESGIYDKQEATELNKAIDYAIDSVQMRSAPLSNKFTSLADEFRAEILTKIHHLAGDDPEKVVRFKNPVYLHFIDDDNYTDCKQVNFNGDCAYVRYANGSQKYFEVTLGELDVAGLYELHTALDEGDFRVVNN